MADITNKKDSLAEQVMALKLVLHGLSDIFLDTNDPDEADGIRLKIAEVREDLFVKQAQLDAVRAMSVIPPVTPEEKAAVLGALKDLDRFVLADQSAHASLDFLMQIADRISKS